MLEAQVLKRIDTLVDDLDALRALVANGAVGANSKIVDGRWSCKPQYTVSEAAAEKTAIETAYENGEISFDKKRGAKMLVTNRTVNKLKKAKKGYTLRAQYTTRTAKTEIAAIEAAFQNGDITYDEKRGLKRSVTIRTQ